LKFRFSPTNIKLPYPQLTVAPGNKKIVPKKKKYVMEKFQLIRQMAEFLLFIGWSYGLSNPSNGPGNDWRTTAHNHGGWWEGHYIWSMAWAIQQHTQSFCIPTVTFTTDTPHSLLDKPFKFPKFFNHKLVSELWRTI